MWGEGKLELHGICNHRFFFSCGHVSPPSGESAAGMLYREEVVRLDQTIRNLIFGDGKISLVMIQLGVTRLKKTGFLYLLVVVWRIEGEGVL